VPEGGIVGSDAAMKRLLHIGKNESGYDSIYIFVNGNGCLCLTLFNAQSGGINITAVTECPYANAAGTPGTHYQTGVWYG